MANSNNTPQRLGYKTAMKRQRDMDESDSDSEMEARQKAARVGLKTWPRFLLIEASEPEDSLEKYSPFAVQKWFEGVSSSIQKIKKLRNASFLVECPNEKASEALRKRDGTNFINTPIKVSIHKSLNSSRGVIRCSELKGVSEGEIKEQLAEEGVTRAQRVFITKNAKKEPTNTIFLTFGLSELPQWIRVGYLRVKVDPFVPSPLRCFKCQKFGHLSKNCQGEEICRNCGRGKHDGKCLDDPHCVNCEGSHQPISRTCPQWKLETEIQKIKTKERCSFGEARAKALAASPRNSQRTYAAAAGPSSKDLSSSSKSQEAYSRLERTIELFTSSLNALVDRVIALEKCFQERQKMDSPEDHQGKGKENENVQPKTHSNSEAGFSVPASNSFSSVVQEGSPSKTRPPSAPKHKHTADSAVVPSGKASKGGHADDRSRSSARSSPGERNQTDHRSKSRPRDSVQEDKMDQ